MKKQKPLKYGASFLFDKMFSLEHSQHADLVNAGAKMSDFEKEFHEALIAVGYNPVDGKVIADDEWHPCLLEGDKRSDPHGSYSLKINSADFAFGCYFDRRDQGTKYSWHSKSDVKLSSREISERKRQLREYEARKEAERDKKHSRLASLLTKVYKKLPRFDEKRAKHNTYCQRKNILPHGIRFRSKGKELIIPIYGPDGRVFSVQRIVPDGGKFLFSGGKKKGNYFPFVKKGEDLSIILICEGFATGATIRQATGLPVAAAIDSGNLVYALHTLKGKFPESRFVICADNDAWTFNESKRPKDIKARDVEVSDPRWEEWREAGMLWNVGIDKARQAAAKCGGASVVSPCFDGLDQSKKPTDFNDLACMTGENVVAEQIMAAVKAIPAWGEAAEGVDASRDPDQQPLGGDYYPPVDGYIEPDYPPPPPEIEKIVIKPKGFHDLNFRCLGHYCGIYYYYSFNERDIIDLTATQHNINNLIRLDNYDNWKNSIFSDKGGNVGDKKMALMAQNAMIQECQRIGVFKQHDYIRGAGAWMDEGRVVVNCGRKLYVDGVLMPFDMLKSEYCYVQTVEMMRPYDVEPLTNTEAVILRRVCEMVSWENPLSGALLAGWLVIAPVCGGLEYTKGAEYRPHIWITGEHECGKSTVLNRIVKVILGRIGIEAHGGYSEAALRSTMKADARPIFYDEAEPSQDMTNVIALARKATTGGIVGKFGQGESRIRFAACFSSINPPVNKSADESRISFFRIIKNRKPTAIEDYDKITTMLEEHITDEFSRRLQARTIANMKTLLANIKTFQRAARRVLGSARAGEQIGTMIAGLYLLHSTDIVTYDFALDWIKKYNWTDHTAIEHKTEPEKLLQHICSSLARVSINGITRDMSFGELIIEGGVKGTDEDKFLRRHGIARIGNEVHFASKHENLKHILRGTDWQDSYQSRLSELAGARKFNQTVYFSSGIRTSSVVVPLNLFMDTTQPDFAFKKQEKKNIEKCYDDSEEIDLDD